MDNNNNNNNYNTVWGKNQKCFITKSVQFYCNEY